MRITSLTKGMPYWPQDALPDGLIPATARLRSRVQERIGPDGSVRDPCHSRVLESALLLALLDRTRSHPAARARLADYLTTQCDCPEPLDRLLARTALNRHTDPADRVDMDHVLDQAPAFTGPRKGALLHAILLLLGGAPTTPAPAPAAYRLEGLHSWARVQVIAVKAVLAHAYGEAGGIGEGELEMLRSTQRAGSVWEGNLLIHLSVLHALTPVAAEQHLVAEGIRTALAYQRGDGGIPFICDEDTWLTVTAGVALQTAGAPKPIVDAVARRVSALQHAGGGWSYTDSARLPDVDCTSVAAEVLHLADPLAHRASISGTLAALHTLKGPEGGFPTYLAGAPSEASMTAAAVNALTTQGPAHRHTIEAALAFLASQQRADGSFPPDWSSSRLHTVFRAVLAASHHPSPASSSGHRIIRRALALVANSQNADGGWGQQDGAASDALSTAYALIALSTQGSPGPAARGIRYLLTRQRPDGSIAGVPDSIGPRPFGFTVPALADVFTLLAFGHLTHRLTPARHPAHARRAEDEPALN
ncbi:prenyltransferase/squalene oxidase repeat-containing protein [Streptomyces sp. NPDC060028]|uniref:prenyltransferase/squalene oxidase repeat-containing protein n=1 Tax=Streptomyces sp. NPDC060028 TaxID=3347041 RepID=UPI0036B36D21